MFSVDNILDPIKIGRLLNQRLAEVKPIISDIVVKQVELIKSNFHQDYYNLVAAYTLSCLEDGQKKEMVIYCSAHSSESRQQTMNNLRLLWLKKVPDNQFQANRPLFYEPGCRALFYVGLPGRNLYQCFEIGQEEKINDYLQLTAKWLSRLHRLTLGMKDWPGGQQQLIGQVVPGRLRALKRIEQNCLQYHNRFIRLYDLLEKREASHWPKQEGLAMIHGDLHPENIVINDQGAAIIDWADASLGDPARDLGSFIQQLIFMGQRHIPDQAYWQQAQALFLETYQQASGVRLTADWSARLETYYYFTAFRTAIYFVTKSGPEPERADGLLTEVEINLS